MAGQTVHVVGQDGLGLTWSFAKAYMSSEKSRRMAKKGTKWDQSFPNSRAHPPPPVRPKAFGERPPEQIFAQVCSRLFTPSGHAQFVPVKRS